MASAVVGPLSGGPELSSNADPNCDPGERAIPPNRQQPFPNRVTSELPITRERFSDLIPCTQFPQRPRYSEVPDALCPLWPASEFQPAYSQRSPPCCPTWHPG